jgi:hypothetical protein
VQAVNTAHRVMSIVTGTEIEERVGGTRGTRHPDMSKCGFRVPRFQSAILLSMIAIFVVIGEETPENVRDPLGGGGTELIFHARLSVAGVL